MTVTNNLTSNEITEITYRKVGDYKIPNITISKLDMRDVGKWGRMHKDFLMKHKTTLFYIMLTNGTLVQYLIDINEQAEKMYETVVEQTVKLRKITERLKEIDNLEWTKEMNSVYYHANEVVLKDLIYV